MATFLDLSLLTQFTSLFAVIFVFVLAYVVTEVVRLGGDNKGLHAVIAFFMALIASASSTVLQIISGMTPWFVLMFVFLVFLLMSIQFIGVKEEDFITMLGGRSGAGWWIFTFAIIILIVAVSNVFGQQLLEESIEGNVTVQPVEPGVTGGTSFKENVSNTLFHPKVLGLVLLLLIGFFTIRFICVPSLQPK